MHEFRKCCRTLKGIGPHERWCPNANQPRVANRKPLALTKVFGMGEDSYDVSDDGKWVTFYQCTVKAETERAVLVAHDGEEWWVPRSLLMDPDVEKDLRNAVDVTVAEWFCRQNELY